MLKYNDLHVLKIYNLISFDTITTIITFTTIRIMNKEHIHDPHIHAQATIDLLSVTK